MSPDTLRKIEFLGILTDWKIKNLMEFNRSLNRQIIFYFIDLYIKLFHIAEMEDYFEQVETVSRYSVSHWEQDNLVFSDGNVLKIENNELICQLLADDGRTLSIFTVYDLAKN